nr:winged helix-turn-helix domain-containing protein [Archaeoglobus neptunius]
MKILARSGVTEILSCLEINSLKFTHLMLETRLNPGVLSRHLKTLMEYAIVEKKSDMYSLTEKGRMIFEILKELEFSV